MLRRIALIILAICAWSGVLLGLALTLGEVYPSQITQPSLIGGPGSENNGFLGNLLDWFSFFTHWGNLIVAIVATLLVIDPNRRGRTFDIAILDAIVMITVTGLIYAIVLAPVAPPLIGLEGPSNVLQHVLTPILGVVVLLGFGPRVRWRWWAPFAALLLPMAYVGWTLVHGAATGAYPYGILDVAQYGYASVLTTIVMIALLGVVVGYLAMGVDRLLPARREAAARR